MKKSSLFFVFFNFLLLAKLLPAQAQLDTSATRLEADQHIQRANYLFQNRRFPEALSAIDQAESKILLVDGYWSIRYSDLCHLKGSVLFTSGAGREAEKYLTSAYEICIKLGGKDSPVYARIVHDFGYLYATLDHQEQAEAYLLEALSLQRNWESQFLMDYVNTLSTLGLYYSNVGNYQKALYYWSEQKDKLGLYFGEYHPQYVMVQSNIAHLNSQFGNFSEAEAGFKKVLPFWEKAGPSFHLEYIRNLLNMAALLFSKGEYRQAEVFYQKACNVQEEKLGKSSIDYWRVAAILAQFYSNTSQFQKAMELYKEVEESTIRLIGDNNIEYAILLGRIGWLYKEIGLQKEAKIRLERGLKIMAEPSGQQLSEYIFLKSTLASLLHSSGQLRESAEQYTSLLGEIETKIGKKNQLYVDQLRNLSTVYTTLGNQVKATVVMEEALAIQAKINGENSPQYAKLLWKQAQNSRSLGNYPAALSSCQAALKIQENTIGTKHPDYWLTLDELAYLYSVTDQFVKADSVLNFLLPEKAAFYGEQSIDYGNTLLSLGILEARVGRWRSAEVRYKKALAIFERTSGKLQHNYIRTLENLAKLYDQLFEFYKALELQQEVLSIREKVQGKEHPEFSRALNALANIYLDSGQFNDALRISEQNLHYLELFNQTNSSTYASALVVYAQILSVAGEVEKAEKIFLRTLEIVANTRGKNHHDYLATLQNLAVFYKEIAQYKKIEPLYLEVLSALREDQLVLKASVLKGLSALYKDLGNFQKASDRYQEAMEVEDQLQSENLANRVLDLVEVGFLFQEMHDYDSAFSTYLKALQIIQNSDGETDRAFSTVLSVLGFLMSDIGNYKEAQVYFEKAINAHQQNQFGSKKEHYAGLLLNLASNHISLQQYSEAAPRVEEAKKILSVKEGQPIHPFYWVALAQEAELLCTNGKFEKATGKLDSVLSRSKQSLLSGMQFMSEKDLRALSEKQLSNRIKLFNLLHFSGTSAELAGLSYNELLFQKGFLQMAALRLNLLSDQSPHLDSIRYQLKSCRKQLYELSILPNPETAVIQLLEEKANTLEGRLARALDEKESFIKFGWKDIQRSLKQGEAAIEFFQFPIQFPSAQDSVQYAALMVLPDQPNPIYLPLCREVDLKAIFSSNPTINASRYTWRGLVDSSAILHANLYPILWQPLSGALDGIKRVYYAPDGLLHRVNFDAIPINNQLYLSDVVELVRLNSTRTLVDQPTLSPLNNPIAALFGAVKYDLDTANSGALAPLPYGQAGTGQDQGLTPEEAIGRWPVLPGTQKEIALIEEVLSECKIVVRDFSGQEASEFNLKNLGQKQTAPGILHLATHGFFERKQDALMDVSSSNNDKSVWGQVNDPMFRSGIVLAGANSAWLNKRAFDREEEDGVVTAYEISQLNFSNTELVVLSACETGLGDVFRNEGVYGLQRAFKVAGAKNLIISLWKVPDNETSEFMVEFYRLWIKEKHTIHAAFYQAQKFMRGRYKDPNKWAGFILVQ